jgi:gas vesicle protein
MRNRIYYSKEAEQRANNERLMFTFVGVLGGLSIGAILMLMFAPQRGQVTRKQIAAGAGTALDEGRKEGEKVIENVRDGIGKLRATVEEKAEKLH